MTLLDLITPALLMLAGSVFVLITAIRRLVPKLDGPVVLPAVVLVAAGLVYAFTPWAGWAVFGKTTLIVVFGALFAAEGFARARPTPATIEKIDNYRDELPTHREISPCPEHHEHEEES